MDLDGAVALVAGGGSGLGLATVEHLIQSGSRVVVLDLPAAEERVSAMSDVVFVKGDVRDPDAVAGAVETATGIGPVRVLVNCAGVGVAARTLRRSGPHPLEDFQRVIDVNLVGTFNTIRLAAAAMQHNEPERGERGVIVNTASVAAYEGQIGQAAYAASKGGIVALTITVARDLAEFGIRCVTIAPGLFDTPLFRTVSEEGRAALARSVPHPARLGDPAEYAALVGHIISNSMINGETLRLDGALRMAPR